MTGPSPSLLPSRFTLRETRLIARAMQLIESKRLRSAPILFCPDDLERYLILRFAGLTNEQGHVLYLNLDYQLLAAETEFFGHQKSVIWDMRQVVLRAICLGAEHVVFAHNHPSENPVPSGSDLAHLRSSEDLLFGLRINLLDSYVVTSHSVTSMRNYRRQQEVLKRLWQGGGRGGEREAER